MDSSINTTAGPLQPVYTPNATGVSPKRAIMLQRYMALTSRQDNVRRRISTSSSTSSNSSGASSSLSSPPGSPRSSIAPHSSPEMTSSSSEPSSTSSSPTLHGQRSSLPQIHAPIYALPKPAQNKKQSTQHQTTMSSIPEDASLTSDDFGRRSSQSISQDEAQLFDINYDIKSTLTDLLNCEAVRNDPKMRIWVQSRLMDAELELKRQRKRTLSAPSIVVSESEELDRRASVA